MPYFAKGLKKSLLYPIFGFFRILYRLEQGRGTNGLSRKSYFHDAVQLYGLHVLACGEGHEVFLQMAARLQGRSPITEAVMRRFKVDELPRVNGAAQGGARRRRRRRPRRPREGEANA